MRAKDCGLLKQREWIGVFHSKNVFTHGNATSNMRKGFIIYTDAQYFPAGSSDHICCDTMYLSRYNPSDNFM